jgi:hypothetical protein
MSDETGSISSIREAIAGLKSDLEETNVSMRQGEMTLIRLTYAFERMGLPKEVGAVLTTLMRMIQTVRLLTVSLTMLEAAEGPLGWLFAGMTLVSAGLTATTAVTDVTQVL